VGEIMNLKQIKDMAIQLIDEYSIEGVINSDGINSDYLLKCNNIINDAQMELTRVRKLNGIKQITQIGNDLEEDNSYSLPYNLIEVKKVLFDDIPFFDFKIELNKILIPKIYEGKFKIFYTKNPEEITAFTPDEQELEVGYDLQPYVAYKLASILLLHENKEIADYFLSEYKSKLNSITNYPDNTFNTIINVNGW
jgi:hypothetical protein